MINLGNKKKYYFKLVRLEIKMLQKLSQHLTEVAKNIDTGESYSQGNLRCAIEKEIVRFEYESGLYFDKDNRCANILG